MFAWFGRVNYCPHTKVAEFADHLKDGRLMASRCTDCGRLSFPPRADCPECRSGAFTFVELSGRAVITTWTRIDAAPAGFEDATPYVLAVADLTEGGRVLAPLGPTLTEADVTIGMAVRVTPRIDAEREDIRVDYTLERMP